MDEINFSWLKVNRPSLKHKYKLQPKMPVRWQLRIQWAKYLNNKHSEMTAYSNALQIIHV